MCSDYNKFYIGQTGKSFTTKYNDHLNTFIRSPYIKANFIGHKDIQTNQQILTKTNIGPDLNKYISNNLKFINTTKCIRMKF
jgi:hypothetical protein